MTKVQLAALELELPPTSSITLQKFSSANDQEAFRRNYHSKVTCNICLPHCPKIREIIKIADNGTANITLPRREALYLTIACKALNDDKVYRGIHNFRRTMLACIDHVDEDGKLLKYLGNVRLGKNLEKPFICPKLIRFT